MNAETNAYIVEGDIQSIIPKCCQVFVYILIAYFILRWRAEFEYITGAIFWIGFFLGYTVCTFRNISKHIETNLSRILENYLTCFILISEGNASL